jgi:hypothetical protein
MNPLALEELRAFRQHVCPLFGCRRDAQYQLLDPHPTAPSIETPAQLSLTPSRQRGEGSPATRSTPEPWI